MRVIAVMPAYQEEARIAKAITGVLRYIPTVLVVDDGSRDQTTMVAKSAGAQVICHAINRGQGAALKTGMRAAQKMGADIILHVDADGQHDPEFLPALLAPIERGEADVVFGSRFLGISPANMPWQRRFLLKLAKWFSHFLLGVSSVVTDPQSGLRAFTAEAAARVDFFQDGFAHCSEILRAVSHSGLRFCEIPVRIRYTEETLTKKTAPHAFAIVWKLFIGSFLS